MTYMPSFMKWIRLSELRSGDEQTDSTKFA
jgi:hypothetical protein